MRVSFDFDGTLGKFPELQKYAKELVDKGIEVWVVTRRFKNIEDYTKAFCVIYNITNLEEQHNYLFKVTEECGIPMEQVHYTNMQDKYKYFYENNDFLWHIDDDSVEINEINKFTTTKAIYVKDMWEQLCNKLIENYNETRM